MRYFVTGASGWIGSALVPELLAAGHQVLALARSDASAAALEAAGADVVRGDLHDLAALRSGAEQTDGVVHLAFIHDFANFEASVAADRAALATFGDALAGSGRPLVAASGFMGVPAGRLVTEADVPEPGRGGHAAGRLGSLHAVLALADRGVRSSAVRFAPTVHGEGDHGFVASYVGLASEGALAAYPQVGGLWPAVHVSDAARLLRLAAESAPAGSVLHAVAEEGVPLRTVAEEVGRQLDLPVAETDPEETGRRFGWLAPFLAFDVRASSERTRSLLGWEPTGPTLLADLESGAYTR